MRPLSPDLGVKTGELRRCYLQAKYYYYSLKARPTCPPLIEPPGIAGAHRGLSVSPLLCPRSLHECHLLSLWAPLDLVVTLFRYPFL